VIEGCAFVQWLSIDERINLKRGIILDETTASNWGKRERKVQQVNKTNFGNNSIFLPFVSLTFFRNKRH